MSVNYYSENAIFTDAKGKPIAARPEAPPADADIEEKIEHMRAVHAYNDAIGSHFHAVFDREFRKALRKTERPEP